MARISKVEDVDKNMKAVVEDPNALTYINPIDDKRFKIEGLAFFEQEKKYFRLPTDCKDKVTEAVYWLAGQPSGGQIRFKTNAKKISVKIKNQGDYLMCHMACTGQQGVDLYYKRKQDKEYKFFTCAKFSAPATEFESVIFSSDEHEEKENLTYCLCDHCRCRRNCRCRGFTEKEGNGPRRISETLRASRRRSSGRRCSASF